MMPSSSPCCLLGLSSCPILDDRCAAVSAISMALVSMAPSSRSFYRDVLERPGVGEARDQAEPGLTDPRPNAVDEGELHQRCIDHPPGHQLLHLVQDRRALLVVEFGGLLLKERVNFGVAAVGVGSALDDERGQPGRGVAKGGAGRL